MAPIKNDALPGDLVHVSERLHSLPVEEVLSALSVSDTEGLSEREVRRRLDLYGANKIISQRRASPLAILLHQLKSPIVYLLGGAAGLALYFGDWEEAIAIAIVLILNAMIGFFTEIKAARSMEALRTLGSHTVRVRREGLTRMILAEDLVPGDIVIVEAGDAVSADLRVIEASNLAADESTLTGESVAVSKTSKAVVPDARLSDQASMLFSGTFVTRGSGVAAVVATGLLTELGRITRLVEEAEPETSPLEQKLAKLSGQLLWVTLSLTIVIAAIGLATGKETYKMVEAAIALAVAAIPEGLPIVATLALARSMWRMAKQNALIERLSAAETLGATTVILTDKTGTLTENRMRAQKFWVQTGSCDASALGDEANAPIGLNQDVLLLLEVAVLCNGAALGEVKAEDNGDPMELALLRAGREAGLERQALLLANPIVRKYAFDGSTNMMATVHRHGDRFYFAVKGAPEAVLASCKEIASSEGNAALDDAARSEWLKRIGEFGRHGLRVIACAAKETADEDASPYEGLVFVGLIGLADPPRADVPQAIRDCQTAGIRVIMATGDHAVTARAIGHAVGLGSEPGVLEGRELARLAGQNNNHILQTGIFARVSPAEKLQIVRAFQAEGEIVAMTGDGVNDAPALQQADIGVAMGLRGTDVAREAADMVLLDDSFPTIVQSIREGRVIFGNIRRFVAYLLSCNLAEVLVVGLAIVSTLPLPLLPLQILFLNLVTDVFPAFALAMCEGERGVMERPPRDPKEPILGRRQWLEIVMQSAALAIATFGALALARLWLRLDAEATITVTFLTLAFAQLWHVFDMRIARSDLWINEVSKNPWIWGALLLCSALLMFAIYVPPLAQVLGLVRPDLTMWLVIIGMSLAPFIAGQIVAMVLKFWRPEARVS
jgi:P-type Ca2+ transporter type 2C